MARASGGGRRRSSDAEPARRPASWPSAGPGGSGRADRRSATALPTSWTTTVGPLRRGHRRSRCPTPPFCGTRVVKGIPLADYASLLDERATFLGQWGLRGARGGKGPSYEELVETEGRPRLRYWLDRLADRQVLEAAVVYGYFPCVHRGQRPGRARRRTARRAGPVHLPAAAPGPAAVPGRLLPRRRTPARLDVVAFQLVTVGQRISEYAAKLFAANAYRDYLEVHGLSVQLTEALAEYWHRADPRGADAADGRSPRPRTRPTSRTSSSSATAAAGTRSATRPAPTWRTSAKIVELLRPGADRGASCPRSSSCTRSSRPTAIVVHHPEAKYFAT